MPPQIFALAKTTLVASAANAQYHSVLFCIFVYSPPRRRIEQREVSPYIVYHILPLCTSAFWRFGNPACMIFILFNSFRFARITQIHSCASNVPKPIFYPRNAHPSFGTLYSFPVYLLTSPFIFLVAGSYNSHAGTAILPLLSGYSYIICAYISTLPSPYNGKKSPADMHIFCHIHRGILSFWRDHSASSTLRSP